MTKPKFRVTLEVTENGWQWQFHQPEKDVASFGMQKTGPGSAKGTQKGGEYDIFPEDIAESIEDGDPMGIMHRLGELEEELREAE